MGIHNKQFWDYWRQGRYEEALQCSAVAAEKKKPANRMQMMLFGTAEQMKQTAAIAAISAGEFLYDYLMIHPTVVKGLEFARTEDLSSLFTLSQFASGIDPTVLTGDMAQLQGYVAEQMLAAELQAKGHDVEFPETSNNPGWDILVDGQPFQVKSLADPAGVRGHLETYPDIPVYVNEELASYFEGNPSVYVSNISREDVLEMTASTLSHADDLLDFEIPWIAAGVSTIHNIKRVWKDDVSMKQAVVHVVSDTSSRVVLGSLGQKAGILVGTMLFGPAGGITGAMLGAYAGASQGGRLSSGIKRALSKKQEQQMTEAAGLLFEKVLHQIDQKLVIKKRKMEQLWNELAPSEAGHSIKQETERHYKQEITYLKHKKEELLTLHQRVFAGSVFLLDVLPQAMAVITKSGVHPVHYQGELIRLQGAVKEYRKKV